MAPEIEPGSMYGEFSLRKSICPDLAFRMSKFVAIFRDPFQISETVTFHLPFPSTLVVRVTYEQ
jgi:CRISPR-associated Cas5-like protein